MLIKLHVNIGGEVISFEKHENEYSGFYQDKLFIFLRFLKYGPFKKSLCGTSHNIAPAPCFGVWLQGIWDPTPGIEPTPPTLEGKVPVTRLPGKSWG